MDGRGLSVERRRTVRRVPGPADPLSRARLRTGPELAIVEISDGGACVRTSARLLPGTRVDVHLVTAEGRVLTRARVARAAVCSIDLAGVTYQAALVFDTPIDSSIRRVDATRAEGLGGRLTGQLLPTPASLPARSAGATGPVAATALANLASDLEKGANRMFVKEFRDVDQ